MACSGFVVDERGERFLLADDSAADRAAIDALEAASTELRRNLESISADGDWGAILEYLDQHLLAIVLAVPDALEQVVRNIPPEQLTEPARLFLSHDFHRVDRPMQAHTASRYQQWVEGQETPLLRDVLGLRWIRLRHLIFDGSFDIADGVADEMVRLLSSASHRVGLEDVMTQGLIDAGTAKLLAGHRESAIGHLRAAARWAGVDGYNPAGLHADNMVALIYALTSDPARAAAFLKIPPDFPKGRQGSRLRLWSSLAVLARSALDVAAGDQVSALENLDAVGAEDPEGNVDGFGEFWWVPVHLHARLALIENDVSRGAETLRRHLLEHYLVAKPGSFAGNLLRADLADMHQAVEAYRDAAEMLDLAERDLRTTRSVASRARLAWLEGKEDELTRQFEEIGPLHPLTSPEFETLRLLHRLEGQGTRKISPADRARWAALRAAGDVWALGLVPSALREVLDAERPRSVSNLPSPFTRPSTAPLSRSEKALIVELRRGETIGELAARVYLSPHTVKTRLREIYRKTGVHSKSELYRERARLLREIHGASDPGPRRG